MKQDIDTLSNTLSYSRSSKQVGEEQLKVDVIQKLRVKITCGSEAVKFRPLIHQDVRASFQKIYFVRITTADSVESSRWQIVFFTE